MATPTDPNFGAGFDADAFRDAIVSTMTMGLPDTTAERVTFRWKTEKTYPVQSPARRPYNFHETPTTTISHADVQVPAAVEFEFSKADLGTAIGRFDTPLAVVTVLDEQYALVEGADQVLLGENTYDIQYWGPPVGLFSVTIYQAYIRAVDET